MELTNKQEQALKIAVARFRGREPYTVISGYAGSGKSTCVKFIVHALNIPNEQVAYVAYTGKAASVLSQKGCPNATTAHKLLYNARLTPQGVYRYIPRISLENPYLRLIVVDEVSMLPKKLWDLLISHGIHVIALGDPGQLPPIKKDEDNGVLENPHIFLDEIVRQARDSGIIRLSMAIRNGERITNQKFESEETRIIEYNGLEPGMFYWADQILCATNKQRHTINDFIRTSYGRPPEPVPGDKIICCHNEWDTFSTKGNPLTNGTIGILTKAEPKMAKYRPTNFIADGYTCSFQNIDDDEDIYSDIFADKAAFVKGMKTFDPKQEYVIGKACKKVPLPVEFNYGYAITTHKAQGSQWDKVLVIEEHFPFDREEHKRWLYTACTRSAEKLVLIKRKE